MTTELAREPTDAYECRRMIAACDRGLLSTGHLWATQGLPQKTCAALKQTFLQQRRELERWLNAASP